MLLVVDVGNTNITLGIFNKDKLIAHFRLNTKIQRTSDEFGIAISNMLELKELKTKDIHDVIIASVVPELMYSFTSGIIKYFNITPIIVGAGTKTGIKVATANPKAVGADRIVDAVGAYEQYGGPVLVIDFGTATTYDYVTEDGSFVAGVITPGIRLSANAMAMGTARLPEIEIKKPETILAKDTVTGMQAGVVYGYIGQTIYIIKKFKEELGIKDLKVVATGGLGKIIADEVKDIQIYDVNLTLNGLRLIYNNLKGKKNANR